MMTFFNLLRCAAKFVGWDISPRPAEAQHNQQGQSRLNYSNCLVSIQLFEDSQLITIRSFQTVMVHLQARRPAVVDQLWSCNAVTVGFLAGGYVDNQASLLHVLINTGVTQSGIFRFVWALQYPQHYTHYVCAMHSALHTYMRRDGNSRKLGSSLGYSLMCAYDHFTSSASEVPSLQ